MYLEAIIQGIVNIVGSPVCLLLLSAGVIIGLIVGLLPGLGATGTMAILLPLVYGLEPAQALTFMIAIFAVNTTCSAVTSILFAIPGETCSAVIILDGHPMAKKGKAGQAFGAAFMASMVGGIFGALVMIALLPLTRQIVLAFGSPELMMVAILGLCMLTVIGGTSMDKALVSAAMGIMISFVGLQYASGQVRYSMGVDFLYEGFKIVPVVMGLFAIPQVIDLMVTRLPIAKGEKRSVDKAQVLEGILATFRHWRLVLRASTIGVIVGIIPGIGATVANWISYAHARQTSKHPEEFGEGNIEGVIAPEAADNAKDGGSLLTTLAFGIPGSSGAVMILVIFFMVGIAPGPLMLTKHLDLTWTIIFTLILANVVATSICILASRSFAKISFLKESILTPVILLLIVLGAYGVAKDFRDVVVAFLVGGFSYLMGVFGYSRVILAIGFILGDYVERYFLISIAAMGPGFVFVSPIASFIGLLTIISLIYGHYKERKIRR